MNGIIINDTVYELKGCSHLCWISLLSKSVKESLIFINRGKITSK